MSDLKELRTQLELEQENLRLSRENNAYMKTIEKLMKDGQRKNEEIEHLKGLIAQAVPVIKAPVGKIKLNISAEEEIAVTQLERLRDAAKQRPLTLEEIRAYDLLVKNKRLGQDESTINLSKGSYRDVTEAELIKLAQGPSDESDKG